MPQPSSITRCRTILGAFVEITVTDEDRAPGALEDLAAAAFGRMARVQSLMSGFDCHSDVCRLNACASLHSLTVHEWTHEVLVEGVRMARESDGVFDIVQTASDGRVSEGSWRDIEFEEQGRIRFRQPMTLDLGSLARGFAMDKAAEILNEAGVRHGVIHAGGDMRFVGRFPTASATAGDKAVPAKIRRAGVQAPAVITRPAFLANQALNRRTVSHILHPRTRKPMRSNISVSVGARSCVDADALANVVLLGEPASWQSLLLRENAVAVFLTTTGELVPFPAAA